MDEYLNTSYDPDVEYVAGVLVRRSAGTQLHGLLQTLVAAFLQQCSRQHRRRRVFTETRLLIDRTSGRHRIPDVMVVEKPYTRGKVVVNVPVIVVEIKSPDDTLDDVIDRCLDYADLGVANIIVLNPESQRQFCFDGHDKALRLVPSITLKLSDGLLLPFPVEDMFAELHEEE